jgi:protein arginine kinase
MAPGLDLKKCLDVANRIDDRLEEKVDFAYDANFGYLTCCPTNTGTGLRASVMVHLPALTESGNINSIIRSLSKLGLAVRGIYGEGSDALGNIYQISNQVTLGASEAETIEKLEQIINELITKERSAGLSIYENNKFRLKDRVMRAKGLLQNAYLITSAETMRLISDVRWGITLGIIDDINHEQLSEALYASLPANIAKTHNTASASERDLKRAEILRRMLA